MLLRLMLLLTVVPLLELALLIKLGQYIGVGYTVLVVVVTGVAGAFLAKTQGMDVLRRMQLEMQEGRLPGNQMIDGLCILMGGAMLLTPGLITDTLGFALVIPVTRIALREWLKIKLRGMVDRGHVIFRWNGW
jgi:UPF0716 protein FxsA